MLNSPPHVVCSSRILSFIDMMWEVHRTPTMFIAGPDVGPDCTFVTTRYLNDLEFVLYTFQEEEIE